jgi:hypothetical protein
VTLCHKRLFVPRAAAGCGAAAGTGL